MLVEAAAGLWTNSLALLSDAAHMLSDAVALGLAAGAARIALRKPTPEKTFGFKRFEVLAAFSNGLILLLLGGGLGIQSFLRLWHPEEVLAGPMMVVALAGLVLNLGLLSWMHWGGDKKNLIEEGVIWHVLGDALGSIGALAAGALLYWKGWLWADAAAGLLIAAVIVFGSLRLLRKSGHILVEGTPEGVQPQAVRQAMLAMPQIQEVHDLHLWTLDGRDLFLSAHVGVAMGQRSEQEAVAGLRRDLESRFGMRHITLQSGQCAAEDCGHDCA
jgi:cobalt-zinc-cadmium efflux system protein